MIIDTELSKQEIPDEFMKWVNNLVADARQRNMPACFFMREVAIATYHHLHPLPPSPVGEAGDKKESIDFMLWVRKEGYYVPNSNHPMTWCNGPRNDWPQMCYTTDELYEMFAAIRPKATPNPSRAGEPKRIIPEGSYFVAQCEKCGFKGASSEWNGGGQIADTGDYGDSYCPVCGHVDVPEADDDIYIDQRELFMTKIWQLGNRISQLEWELYESKTERAGESDSEMRNNAIAFTIWAAEKGWLLHPDQDEDEEYGFYKPSDDFDIPDERLFGGQLYDLYLQHLNDSK